MLESFQYVRNEMRSNSCVSCDLSRSEKDYLDEGETLMLFVVLTRNKMCQEHTTDAGLSGTDDVFA